MTKARKAEQPLRLALDIAGLGSFDWDVQHDRIGPRRSSRSAGLELGTFGGTVAAFQSFVLEDDLPTVGRAIADSLDARFRRGAWPTMTATVHARHTGCHTPAALSG